MKKVLSVVVLGVLTLGLLACSNSTEEVEQANIAEAVEKTDVVEETGKADNEETVEIRSIKDQNDRLVELPGNIERIATGRILPFPAVYFLATGSTDQIVGIHPASKSAADTSMLGKMSPSLLKAKTNFIQGNDINVEELLKLETDLVFVYGDNGHKIDEYEMAGIKSVGIRTMSIAEGNSVETLNSWLELLGEITDQEDRAKEIISYGRQIEEDIQKNYQQ